MIRFFTDRRARRTLGGLCALSLAASAGCVGRGLGDAVTDVRLNLRAERAALAGWHRRADCYDDLGHPLAFKHGFKDGYLDAAHGGEGTAPAVPPKCYWDCHADACERTETVNAYYQGFAHGVMAAGRDGVVGMSQVPVKCPCEPYRNLGGTYCPPLGALPPDGPADLPGPVLAPPPAPMPSMERSLDADGPLDPPGLPDDPDPLDEPGPTYEPTVLNTAPPADGAAEPSPDQPGTASVAPLLTAERPADLGAAEPDPAEAGGVPFAAEELEPADDLPVGGWGLIDGPTDDATPVFAPPQPSGPEAPGRSSVTLEPFLPSAGPAPAVSFEPPVAFEPPVESEPPATPGRARLDLALELFAAEADDAAAAAVPPAPAAGDPAAEDAGEYDWFAAPTLP